MAVRATRNQLWLLGLARDGKLYHDGIDSLAVDLWSGIRGRGDRIVTVPVGKLRDRGLLELGAVDAGRRPWCLTEAGLDALAREDRRRERAVDRQLGGRTMSEYIPEWRIDEFEERLRGGEREAGERLVRFYEQEIASMAVRRDRALRALAELREPLRVDVDEEEPSAIEA